MVTERKITAKTLSFAPGKLAVTPTESVMEEMAPATSDASAGLSSLKGVVVYLAPAEAIALKVYAAQNSTSIQQLGTEAFAELFRRRGINGGTLTRVKANRKNGGNR